MLRGPPSWAAFYVVGPVCIMQGGRSDNSHGREPDEGDSCSNSTDVHIVMGLWDYGTMGTYKLPCVLSSMLSHHVHILIYTVQANDSTK